MIPELPNIVWITFVLTVALCAFLFYLATNKSRQALRISLLWILLQSSVSLTLFYTQTNTLPPRFALLIVPPFLLILMIFITKSGKQFIDQLDVPMLTALHMVRIPVEIVLYWLFLNSWVPDLMTFAGRNFDVLSGITAPVMFSLVFYRKLLGPRSLLIWNFVCLGLVLFIVVNAILSVETPFQQFGFDQPNRGVTYFPFILLPAFVVPVVIFSHLASIRILLKGSDLRED